MAIFWPWLSGEGPEFFQHVFSSFGSGAPNIQGLGLEVRVQGVWFSWPVLGVEGAGRRVWNEFGLMTVSLWLAGPSRTWK